MSADYGRRKKRRQKEIRRNKYGREARTVNVLFLAYIKRNLELRKRWILF
jgi:hypothetical protein